MAVPERVVANAAVAEAAGVTEQWIVHRTGIHERRHVGDGERLADLATAAGREALERAGVDASELDLVLVATVASDDPLPNAAPVVAMRLGAARAGALDVGAACTGFLTALSLASAQVESGRATHALVIGAEVLSRFIDRSDKRTAAIFADGAGAAVVGPAADVAGEVGPIVLHADGEGGPAIAIARDEGYVRMQGHDTFREAVRRMSEATLEALEAARMTLDDVELFVYHQANGRILTAVAERLGLDRERVVDCIGHFGNTSAASIPIALSEAESEGRLHSGSVVLLAAFGAGFTWGAGVIRWP